MVDHGQSFNGKLALTELCTYIRNCLYSQVCKRYIGIGVVVPPLYRLLFVLAAIDNIDINSSSTTAMTNLHGTAVSLFQCLCRNYAGMIEGSHPGMNSIEHTHSLDFPEYYTSIEPVSNSTMKKEEIPLQCNNQGSAC